jgi:sec-independent protein translocase protein TatA
LPTLGPTELIIILVIILVVFGVGRLPDVGRSIGQGVRELRESAQLLKEEEQRLTKQADDEPGV